MHRLLYGQSLGMGQEILKVEEAVSAVKSRFYARRGAMADRTGWCG